MRRTMVVAALAGIVAMLAFSVAQTYAATSRWQAGGAAAAVGPRGTQGGAAKLAHEGQLGPGRPGLEGRPMADIHRLLMIAVTAPWAKDNADVQKLVDAILADRKTMLTDEGTRVAAVEQLVQAARAGDAAAVKAAREALKAANEKCAADARQLRDDLRALHEKIRALRPEGATEGQELGGKRAEKAPASSATPK